MSSADEAAHLNIAAEILRRGDDAGVALRFRSDEERIDVGYAELRRRVRQMAAVCEQLGIQEEQRVLVILPDCPEYVYAFLGAIWAGAVPVLVSTFLRPGDYLPFVRETRARAVITTAAVAEVLEAEARPLPAVLTVGDRRSGTLWQAIEDAPASSAPFPTHRDDPAFWLYSSGTTGRPKGAFPPQRAILRAVGSKGRSIPGGHAPDVAYTPSRLFFAYGLGASRYFPLPVAP